MGARGPKAKPRREPTRIVSQLALPKGCCVEVCEGDTLVGYAIFFSGAWDAWVMTGVTGHRCLSQYGSNMQSAAEAVEVIRQNYWLGKLP